ncbi:hypothetical protein D8Y22_10915 [Salinadaptatus halalkaliphilus]|uniref:Uncharacterized protein n=1 Tax=Salinadaptatus halalkaliphilus TaxID=2419781 RepID=A0A4S3TKT0_9EURY|nr:hypothetical protein D8Y22_10915 [Salinadaptatus halalkaliphilus]
MRTTTYGSCDHGPHVGIFGGLRLPRSHLLEARSASALFRTINSATLLPVGVALAEPAFVYAVAAILWLAVVSDWQLDGIGCYGTGS